jgi:hypothetical protein
LTHNPLLCKQVMFPNEDSDAAQWMALHCAQDTDPVPANQCS